MVKSMTGYGRASETLNSRGITVEVRSVNHRYLDCTVKSPRAYAFLDEKLKACLSEFVARGKVDLYISIDNSDSANVSVSLNESLLNGYFDVFERLSAQYGVNKEISVSEIIRIPDVLVIEKQEDDEEELSADVLSVLKKALTEHNEMRQKEGRRLAEDILSRLKSIEDLAKIVEERSPKCVEEYREKLELRMREVLESVTVD